MSKRKEIELTGYWAMTYEDREQHDARLLDEERLHLLSPDKRRAYLEALSTHTLIGSSITFDMLNHPDYMEYQEHLYDVLSSLLDRQERLTRYLRDL